MYTDGVISDLSFDWVEGTLYGVSLAGTVFTCEARTKGPITCHPLLRKENEPLSGIAVDANNG